MVDVDNFKTINDRYGHGIGDQVLQQVAEALKASVRGVDLVCRYGGEEFCILLPHTDAQDAFEAAERFRQAIACRPLTGIPVTASFGTSSIYLGARELHDLLDQADKALYAAKREGRNRVVLWDPSLPDDAGRRSLPAEPAHARDDRPDVPIPFHAVTALLSALAYRDPYTAEHSRRVADLCVATANGLLSQSQCYVLEVAALLHDIGKLGVADAILRKPGPLTDLEWKAIRTHEKIGEEIINAAFTCRDVATTVRCHHLWYRGGEQHPRRGRGEAIPLGARILAIADAYDAMVSDRVYRKERSRAEAFAELRRCAGEQFDPLLVERFIEVVQARDDSRTQPTLCVSKQTALRIGMQIENLACSLDSHDLDTLAQMAGQLHATAVENGIAPMAEAAAQLEQTLAEERDWVTLMQQAMDLMELCRSTYRAYLPRVSPAPAAAQEEVEGELASCQA
jgi:diguanylate cyclase (GGDEF)-like protein